MPIPCGDFCVESKIIFSEDSPTFCNDKPRGWQRKEEGGEENSLDCLLEGSSSSEGFMGMLENQKVGRWKGHTQRELYPHN